MIRGLLPTLIFSIILFFSIDSFATKIVAVGNGNWSDINVWNLARIPNSADTVYIGGYTLNVENNYDVKAIFITNPNLLNNTSLNILGTLTITGDLNATAENVSKDIDVLVYGDGILTVNGNANFIRTSDNSTANRLQFHMYGNSKTYILGDFTFDYKNSSDSESSFDIYTSDNAILDVTGQTTLITRDGLDLDFVLQGTSQVILRDSLSLLLYGGYETAITADQNSHFQLLANAYLLNAGGLNHTKLKSGNTGGKMTISGSVYMESTVDDMKIKLEATGASAELNIGGDIVMSATSDSSVEIHLRTAGELNFGGNILRPTSFGQLKMETNGKLVFNGTNPQFIPEGNLDGSGLDSLYFGIVSFKNTSGSPIILTSDLIIKDSLVLSTGNIKTSNDALLIIEKDAFIKGGDSDSYVEGPMMKIGQPKDESFIFPIGDENNYAPLMITPDATKDDGQYTAQYYSDPPPFGLIHLSIDNKSNTEYWELTKSSGTPDSDITLSWYDAATQGINNLDDLVVVGLTPSQTLGNDPEWKSYGNGGTTGTIGTNGSGTITNSLASDPPPFGIIYFTYGSTTVMNSLPVDLTSFQAVQQNSHAYLQWETASEINTSHFSIERSIDGIDFKSIGNVQGNGDAVIAHQYTFKDIIPEDGVNYYRLKIVDHDNTFEYSNIEVIKFEATPAIQLFPNPVKKTIQLEGFDPNLKNVQLEILDRNGQLIFNHNISINDGKLQVPVEAVNIQNPGTYFLRVIGQGQSHVIKFIKIN